MSSVSPRAEDVMVGVRQAGALAKAAAAKPQQE